MDQNPTLALEPPRFERGKAILVAGLKGHYRVQQVEGIPAQWQRFAPYLGTLPGQVGRKTYGVCYQGDETCSFDYLCGVEVESPVGPPGERSQVRGEALPLRGNAFDLVNLITAFEAGDQQGLAAFEARWLQC